MNHDLAFRMQIFIEGTADQVWEALTTQEQLSQWWDPLRSADWNPGGMVVFDVDDGYKIDCEIIEIDRPRTLVMTFDCDRYPDHPPTRVRWEVEPVEGGCLLRLVHDGFPSVDKGLADVSQHWPTMIADMKRLIEAQPAQIR